MVPMSEPARQRGRLYAAPRQLLMGRIYLLRLRASFQ